jgi:hypothetical protein
MKTRMLILAMLASILSFPLVVSAKGKPVSAAILKDANGVETGRVIGMETASWPYVLTEQGYRTLLRVGTGMIYNVTTLYYASGDCSGQAYVRTTFPGTVFIPTSQDSLAYAMGAIYYSPNEAQGVTVNVNSQLDGSLSCIPYNETRQLYPAYPNEPTTTGIQNTAYPTRMLIE